MKYSISFTIIDKIEMQDFVDWVEILWIKSQLNFYELSNLLICIFFGGKLGQVIFQKFMHVFFNFLFPH